MPKFRTVQPNEVVLLKPVVTLSKEVQEVIAWVEKIEKGSENEVTLESGFKGLGRAIKRHASVRGKLKIKCLDADGKTWRILVQKGSRSRAKKGEAAVADK